jgi:DNA (cytosine-5)-methyltransferase 1
MSHARAALGVSLFSSGGIGDLAMKAAGINILVANELLEERGAIYQANFPESLMLIGDLRELEDRIVTSAKERLAGRQLDILFATPPCQGMSKNGRGKLLSEVRAGRKPEMDVRNTLIVNTMNIISALDPCTVIFENVPEMESTLIEVDGNYVGMMDFIRSRFDRRYSGSWAVVEFADYGVPQRRQRLITVFSRNEHLRPLLDAGPHMWLYAPTHAKAPALFQKPWKTVMDAIGQVPPLDAKNEASAQGRIPFHKIPVLDSEKYFWVSNTPPGSGAFDNQCVNPACLYQGNPTHGASHDSEGINRSHRTTPVRCMKCNELLPRPWVRSGSEYRIMTGFTSAYKRMRGDLPASALTRNLSYACSDQKLHPMQHRVLSIYEALIIHTITDYEYKWARRDGKKVSDKTIREIIGESIPPKGLEFITRYLFGIINGTRDLALAHGPVVEPLKKADVSLII